MSALETAYEALRIERADLVDRLQVVTVALDAIRPLVETRVVVEAGRASNIEPMPDPYKAAGQDPPPKQKSPGRATCRWCDVERDVRGIRTHERHGHPTEYQAAQRAADIPVHEPVPITPTAKPDNRRPVTVELSPPPGKGGFVTSGIRTPIDEDKARRAAFS